MYWFTIPWRAILSALLLTATDLSKGVLLLVAWAFGGEPVATSDEGELVRGGEAG